MNRRHIGKTLGTILHLAFWVVIAVGIWKGMHGK